jgi:ABC-2 type transport system ATP-binding protein
MLQLIATNIAKRYNQQWIFKAFSASYTQQDKVAIIGHNGSGKSTLLQILAGYVQATQGTMQLSVNDKLITKDLHFKYLAYCSPAMELIEDFSLVEFLDFHYKHKHALIGVQETINLLGLQQAAHKRLAYFSSGMRQRVKLAQALCVNTPMVFLDEPTSNLDENGIKLYNLLLQQFATNKLLLISSNNKDEYAMCSTIVDITAYK